MPNSHRKQIRHTKIVITLGPSTDDPQVMHQLIEEGVNVVRLNFSHGSHAEHKKRMDLVRDVAKAQDNRRRSFYFRCGYGSK